MAVNAVGAGLWGLCVGPLACLDADDGPRVRYVDQTRCVGTPGATTALAFYPGGKVQAAEWIERMINGDLPQSERS